MKVLDTFSFFKQALNEWVIQFLLLDKDKVGKQVNYLEEQMKITLYTC